MSDRALVIAKDPQVFSGLKRACVALQLTADSAADAQSASALFTPKAHRVVFVDTQAISAADAASIVVNPDALPGAGPAVIVIRDRKTTAPDVRPLAAAVLDCIDKPFGEDVAKRRLARALGVMDLEHGLRQTEAKLAEALIKDADADADALVALERALEVEFARARIRNLALTCLTIAGDPAKPLDAYAKRIEGKLRTADQVFPVDDAELVVLLPGTDAKGAKKVVQTIGGLQKDESVVMGAATFPHQDVPQAAVLYRAANLSLVNAQFVAQGQTPVSYFEGF